MENEIKTNKVEEQEFKGTLKEVINQMLLHDTDNCEVTHTLGDIQVVVDITITKIKKGDKILYDAASEEDADVEVTSFTEEDLEQIK